MTGPPGDSNETRPAGTCAVDAGRTSHRMVLGMRRQWSGKKKTGK